MYKFIITAKGRALLAKLLALKTFEISRVMVGTGEMPEDTHPGYFTDLIAPVAEATSTKPIVKDATVSFVVEYRSDLNGGLEQGFWIREYGVFAIDPDVGEILLYYANLGEYPQYVMAYRDGIADTRRFPVSITLIDDDVEVVTAFPPDAFMTSEDVDQFFKAVYMPVLLADAQRLVDIHNTRSDAHLDIRNENVLLTSRVQRVEDILSNNARGSSFVVAFDNLNEVEVEGVWNETLQRIEF